MIFSYNYVSDVNFIYINNLLNINISDGSNLIFRYRIEHCQSITNTNRTELIIIQINPDLTELFNFFIELIIFFSFYK
jgi:hypothetical protein